MEANKEILEKNQTRRIYKIVDRLFEKYMETDIVRKYLDTKFNKKKQRSLLLTIMMIEIKEIEFMDVSLFSQLDPKAIHFGVRLFNGNLERWLPDDISRFDVQCIICVDTFVDLLNGKSKYDAGDFNIQNAWVANEIQFVGNDSVIHKELLFELLETFREMLGIKKMLNL